MLGRLGEASGREQPAVTWGCKVWSEPCHWPGGPGELGRCCGGASLGLAARQEGAEQGVGGEKRGSGCRPFFGLFFFFLPSAVSLTGAVGLFWNASLPPLQPDRSLRSQAGLRELRRPLARMRAGGRAPSGVGVTPGNRPHPLLPGQLALMEP